MTYRTIPSVRHARFSGVKCIIYPHLEKLNLLYLNKMIPVIPAGMGTGAHETAFWCVIINALTTRANKDCQAIRMTTPTATFGSVGLMGGFPYRRFIARYLLSF